MGEAKDGTDQPTPFQGMRGGGGCPPAGVQGKTNGLWRRGPAWSIVAGQKAASPPQASARRSKILAATLVESCWNTILRASAWKVGGGHRCADAVGDVQKMIRQISN